MASINSIKRSNLIFVAIVLSSSVWTSCASIQKYVEAGDLAGGERFCEEQTDPEKSQCISILADAYYKGSDFENAITFYEKVSNHGKLASSHENLAQKFESEGNTDQAETHTILAKGEKCLVGAGDLTDEDNAENAAKKYQHAAVYYGSIAEEFLTKGDGEKAKKWFGEAGDHYFLVAGMYTMHQLNYANWMGQAAMRGDDASQYADKLNLYTDKKDEMLSHAMKAYIKAEDEEQIENCKGAFSPKNQEKYLLEQEKRSDNQAVPAPPVPATPADTAE